MSIINLPVSLGEGLDKLSILDIKLIYIKDQERRTNVQKEYDMIYNELKMYMDKYIVLYTLLKNININIWKLMDLLRDGELSDSEYTNICKETIIANDVRFRIKDRINRISNSILKEQKGYQVLRCVIDINLHNTLHNDLIMVLYYYSLIYDELYVFCNNNFESVLKNKCSKEFNIIISSNCMNIENVKKYITIDEHNIFENVNEQIIRDLFSDT